MNDLTLQNHTSWSLSGIDAFEAPRHFWSVERFFQITTLAASVNLVLLFAILIGLTVPGCSQLFAGITF